MAPAPGGGPGGASAGPGRKGTPPRPALRAGRAWPAGLGRGLGGRGRRGRDRGRGAVGRGPVGSGGASAAGCPGPNRSSCDPSPAAPSLSSPRSRRGGAGGGAAVRAASGGRGWVSVRPSASAARAPPPPQPQGHVSMDAHPWHNPPPPTPHNEPTTATLGPLGRVPAPLPSFAGHGGRTEVLSAKHLSPSEGSETPGLKPEKAGRGG